jgi:hypothetical protein
VVSKADTVVAQFTVAHDPSDGPVGEIAHIEEPHVVKS